MNSMYSLSTDARKSVDQREKLEDISDLEIMKQQNKSEEDQPSFIVNDDSGSDRKGRQIANILDIRLPKKEY